MEAFRDDGKPEVYCLFCDPVELITLRVALHALISCDKVGDSFAKTARIMLEEARRIQAPTQLGFPLGSPQDSLDIPVFLRPQAD